MVLALQYLKLWKKRKTDAAGFFRYAGRKYGRPDEKRNSVKFFGKMKKQ